jgi:hypothetical protein
VLLDLGNNKQPSEPKHNNTHSGNLHGLLPVLHRSDRWPAPVRPVTPVRPVDSAGQAGGYSSHTTSVPESLSDFCRPWNKTRPKRNLHGRKNLHKTFRVPVKAAQGKSGGRGAPIGGGAGATTWPTTSGRPSSISVTGRGQKGDSTLVEPLDWVTGTCVSSVCVPARRPGRPIRTHSCGMSRSARCSARRKGKR